MLPENKKVTNLSLASAIVLAGVGHAIGSLGDDMYLLGRVVALSALIPGLWGCVSYAKGKGYSGWLGLLGLGILPVGVGIPIVFARWAGGWLWVILGLLFIGMLILVLLPDRYRKGRAQGSGANRPASDSPVSCLPSESGPGREKGAS